MLYFSSPYITGKPIKCVFFEPDLINVTGFYFTCQETIIIIIEDRSSLFFFWSNAKCDSWGSTMQNKNLWQFIFFFSLFFYVFNVALSHCGIISEDSRSNIGLLAESLQMSHVCCSCYRSSVWHTQAHRRHNSKWQSSPVDTCHPIYACLKHYRSITALFYHVNSTANARIIVMANKP